MRVRFMARRSNTESEITAAATLTFHSASSARSCDDAVISHMRTDKGVSGGEPPPANSGGAWAFGKSKGPTNLFCSN